MSTTPEHSYADTLSFLISQVGARSAQLFAELLLPLGVSPRAYGVLSNLNHAQGQTQQQLADALGIHRNNMVGVIDELEAAGWVRRQRSTVDRRAFEVQLTKSGRAVVAKVDRLRPSLEARIGAGLTPREHHTMTALLRKIADSLELSAGVHPHLSGAARRSRTEAE